MWTKERILSAYQEATADNDGIALGQSSFDKIVPSRAWRGKFFARFSDLVREAGYEPRTKNLRHNDDILLEPVAALVRRLGRLATEDERILERRRISANFPSNTVLRKHFGGPDGMTAALKTFCESRNGYADVLKILVASNGIEVAATGSKITGFVYLMKYGKFYKIGFTSDVGKRRYDLKLLVPEQHRIIHQIETDDPRGIEAYWHTRFAGKRCEGTREYFDLSPEDVAAFKRRKRFM